MPAPPDDLPPSPRDRLEDRLGNLFSARLVIVTGKGGVGKTTVAAALAGLAAAAGKRVLLADVGAQPRGEAGSELGGEPGGQPGGQPGGEPGAEESSPQPRRQEGRGRRGGGLWTVLLTPEAGHRAFLRDMLPVGFLADRAMSSEPLRRFLQAAPAFAELGVLYRGLELVHPGRGRGRAKGGAPPFDLVVLDAPATGHTLAFAALPQLLLQAIPVGPIGRAAREGMALLRDPAQTRAVVTTVPEALPVTEALELLAGLERAQLAVHGVVANLVPEDPFTPDEHLWLGRYLERARAPGARSVRRLWRAQVALQRLEVAVGPVLRVRERTDLRLPLVEAVAEDLARGFARTGHSGPPPGPPAGQAPDAVPAPAGGPAADPAGDRPASRT